MYISETTMPINVKILDNIWIMKICSLTQYYDIKTNSKWRKAAILKTVI